MPTAGTEARALLEGNPAAVDRLASKLLKPLSNNFVERPWGGSRMLEHKGLPTARVSLGCGIGEAFEISADDRDAEARQYPSRMRFTDGSELALPRVLELHADALLGPKFVQRYGACFPLLPKTLDIAELLSVQAHPEGNTEVYVIIACDAGATIRLGFNADVDPRELDERLGAGRQEQQRLLELLVAGVDQQDLHRLLKPWLAQRNASTAAIEARVTAAAARRGLGSRGRAIGRAARALLGGSRFVERDSGGAGASDPQRESAADRRGERSKGIGRGARSRQSGRARDSRARDPTAGPDVSRLGQRALSLA